jgi:hypothetical protein
VTIGLLFALLLLAALGVMVAGRSRTVESRLSRIDGNPYPSPDHEGAAVKVEITAKSGAGDVIVMTK